MSLEPLFVAHRFLFKQHVPLQVFLFVSIEHSVVLIDVQCRVVFPCIIYRLVPYLLCVVVTSRLGFIQEKLIVLWIILEVAQEGHHIVAFCFRLVQLEVP